MKRPSFSKLIKTKWDENKFVCIGLDSDFEKLPEHLIEPEDDCPEPLEVALLNFNKSIIDATSDLVCAYKINSAFYEVETQAWEAMVNTFYYIIRTYPDIPVILDAKRADIGNTNEGYVRMAFEKMEADAITLHPYLGKEALEPFLKLKDKGIFILVRTSNPGAGEFQDLKVDGKPLYQVVAEHVASGWNENGNCGLVIGATYPEELKIVREIVGDLPILIPGIGAQGGDLEATIKAGKDSKGQGMIISASRSIIFASSGEDFAEAARRETEKLHNEINKYVNS